MKVKTQSPAGWEERRHANMLGNGRSIEIKTNQAFLNWCSENGKTPTKRMFSKWFRSK